jgi:LPPG:FO 2-phospho-L-lactate transferase
MAADRWWTLQEFMIRHHGQGPVQGVQFRGAGSATATSEVLAAITTAKAIVIGPSNPVISIGPILAVAEIRAALQDGRAPVVAVSPFVHGQVLKGPTAAFLEWQELATKAQSLTTTYAGLLDGVVSDEPLDSLPALRTDVLMDDAEGRRRLAAETLEFAGSLQKNWTE